MSRDRLEGTCESFEVRCTARGLNWNDGQGPVVKLANTGDLKSPARIGLLGSIPSGATTSTLQLE